VVEQAQQCLLNIESALAEAKCTFADPRMKIEIEVHARRATT
jgi:hypothetical protein